MLIKKRRSSVKFTTKVIKSNIYIHSICSKYLKSSNSFSCYCFWWLLINARLISFFFLLWSSLILSSIVFLQINLFTNTFYFYPILSDLPIAWSSIAGLNKYRKKIVTFHQGSTINTLFAIVKFNPVELAFIDKINAVLEMSSRNC